MPRQKSTHVDDPHAVGRRLRDARRRAGLSQRELAFRGCTPAYISRIEAGDRIPSLQLLRELGRQLGVSADFLATGVERNADERATLVQAEVALRMDDVELASSLYREVLDGAEDARVRGAAAAGLGQIAFRRGDPRAAIGHFEEALALLGDDETLHPALADSLGRACAIVGETARAIDIFERCLQTAEASGDPVERMRFSVLLANALVDVGSFERAQELLGGALAEGDELLDPLNRARLYWSQSRLQALKGDAEAAGRHARNALAILEVTEHDHHTARAHQLLAHIELDRGHPEDALRLVRRGLELLGDSGSRYERAKFELEEAKALAGSGRGEDAVAVALRAAGTLTASNPGEAGRGYGVVAEALEELGDVERARELYELAAELLEREPNRYLTEVLSRLAALHEREGNKEAAYETLKRAVSAQRAGAAA